MPWGREQREILVAGMVQMRHGEVMRKKGCRVLRLGPALWIACDGCLFVNLWNCVVCRFFQVFMKKMKMEGGWSAAGK
jgi:hypothetical protein